MNEGIDKIPMAGSTDAESKTAFVSGPIEFPVDFFATYYEHLLAKAISLGHSFVMGPAPGTDRTSLRYLLDHDVDPSKITVYLAEFEERTLLEQIKWFVELGGKVKVEGVSTSERDAAMTRDSDYDILRYMTIEGQQVFYGKRYFPRVSATEKNERRRKGLPLHVNDALGTRTSIASPGTSAWIHRVKNIFRTSSSQRW